MPQFVLDHTALVLDPIDPDMVSDRLQALNDVLARLVESGEVVEKLSDAWWAEVLPGVSLSDLFYEETNPSLDQTTLQGLLQSINRTVDCFVDDFARFVLDYATAGTAVALICVDGNSTSAVPNHPSIRVVCDERSLLSFYRAVFSIENVSEERFFEFAALAFPDLYFNLEHTRFNRFAHPYPITRPLVVKHLEALNDYFRAQVAACQGNSSELTAYFKATHNVDLSPESTNTRGRAKLMAERRVEIDGVEYLCEWHTKLFPTEDRIHFNFEANLQLNGRIVIGIFAKHLAT